MIDDGITYETLSWRQRRLLDALHQFRRAHGYPPSVRALMAETGISSTSTVAYNLNVLEQMGLVAMDEKKARTIRLTEEGRRVLALAKV